MTISKKQIGYFIVLLPTIAFLGLVVGHMAYPDEPAGIDMFLPIILGAEITLGCLIALPFLSAASRKTACIWMALGILPFLLMWVCMKLKIP